MKGVSQFENTPPPLHDKAHWNITGEVSVATKVNVVVGVKMMEPSGPLVIKAIGFTKSRTNIQKRTFDETPDANAVFTKSENSNFKGGMNR